LWQILGIAVVGVAAVIGWLVFRAAPAAAPPPQTMNLPALLPNTS